MDLLIFILSCYGLTQILVYSKLFEKIRPKHHFFHCPMCMGFWVGMFLYILTPFTGLIIMNYSLAGMLTAGLISSGTSYILCNLFGDEGVRYERKSNY